MDNIHISLNQKNKHCSCSPADANSSAFASSWICWITCLAAQVGCHPGRPASYRATVAQLRCLLYGH